MEILRISKMGENSLRVIENLKFFYKISPESLLKGIRSSSSSSLSLSMVDSSDCQICSNEYLTLAKEKLGWKPKSPLEEGLKKTIEYFGELLKKGKL